MDRSFLPTSAIAAVALLAIAGVASAQTPASQPDPAGVSSSVFSSDHAEPEEPPSVVERDAIPAPDFALPVRSGEPFRLSNHHGEVVVLNLWATWCPPCRHEIPDFIALQDELGADGLTVVGVSLDEGGWEDVGPFVDEMGINYHLAIDDGTVESLFGPTASLPTTFLIDREGNVAHYLPGMILRDELEPLLLPLLDQPTP